MRCVSCSCHVGFGCSVVLGSFGCQVGVFGARSAVLGPYPIWGIACVGTSDNKQALFFKLMFPTCRGVQHGCGTALNEATTTMGYRG